MRMRIYAYKLRMRWTLISERYCKSFLQIIKNFSLRHKLHFLLILSYGLQVASTFHCTRNGFLASFRVHMYFDSSVSFLLFTYIYIDTHTRSDQSIQ